MAWHAQCYRVEGIDPFPRDLQPKEIELKGDGKKVEASQGWEVTAEERHDIDNLYIHARSGDHLMTSFECECCHFKNIYKRTFHPHSDKDKWALKCIVRANLDAFWARKKSTVGTNLTEGRRSMKASKSFGLETPVNDYPRGP